MRILLLGKNGQVGGELHRLLAPAHEVVAVGRQEADLARPEELRGLVGRTKPRIIINAAAYNAVDRAESEPGLAEAVNATAPGVLAAEAAQRRAAFVHFSTDYVFDGRAGRPYVEADPPNPLNTYGKSKHRGEIAVLEQGGVALILRTSWVYSLHRPCFVTQVLAWSRTKDELRIAEDQTSAPTWCRVVAQATAGILDSAGPDPWEALAARAGIYHLANRGAATRYEWATAILALDPKAAEQRVPAQAVIPGRRSDFPSAAERPAFTVLDSSRVCEVFGLRLPAWRDSLKQAMRSS